MLHSLVESAKSVSYKYEYALELVDNNDDRIQHLLSCGVIRQNGNNLEIGDLFLQFFEQVLNALVRTCNHCCSFRLLFLPLGTFM
jgi:hypothetical protein